MFIKNRSTVNVHCLERTSGLRGLVSKAAISIQAESSPSTLLSGWASECTEVERGGGG